MDIEPPVYYRDEAPDYRRLLITYSHTQPLNAQFWVDVVKKELEPFGGELYAEFSVEALCVKIWNLTNEERSVDDAIYRLQTRVKEKDFTAERDMRLSVLALTNDKYSERQWALTRIEAQPAWERVAKAGSGRPPVTVAVIDSGAQPGHQDLDGPPRLDGIRVVPPIGPNFADDTGHGTMLAGTIAAVSGNDIGIAGVASNPITTPTRLPDLRLFAVKFDDARNPPTASRAVAGMTQAAHAGAQVINASWHVLDGSGVLFSVIQALAPVLVVAAAGNRGMNNAARPPTLPASYNLPNILSVMASNEDDYKAWFSNYGTNVDIAAPGTRIISTSMYYVAPPVPPHRIYNPAYRTYSGTSPAAAHASGAAALLLAIDNWSPVEIREHLTKSADFVPHLNGLCRANGRLNVHRAICGPFRIVSPGGGNHAPSSPFTVQWTLDYDSPVVQTVEITINRHADGALVAPLVSGIPANTPAFPTSMPSVATPDVIVRVRCLEKNLYADSAPFDIV
jgi:subtilisin family serine protease